MSDGGGFNLFSVVLLGTGGILIYSAVKGYDPRTVVKSALQGKSLTASDAVYSLGLSPGATGGAGGAVSALPPSTGGKLHWQKAPSGGTPSAGPGAANTTGTAFDPITSNPPPIGV